MKGYKLVAAHPHSIEVMHPDGTTFHVAKAGLDLPMLQKMMKLPQYFADGGDVEGDAEASVPEPADEAAPESQEAPIPQAEPTPGPAGTLPTATPDNPTAIVGNTGGASDTYEEPPQTAPTPAAQTPQATPAPSPAPAQAAPTGSNPIKQLNASYAQTTKGIKGEAEAKASQADAQQGILDNYAKAQQDLAAKTQAQQDALSQQTEQLKQDIASQKIDPNRYLNNMSTGNKISAAIGLVLSGIGSGLSGQPNLAAQTIHNAIDDDVKAQYAELGKKQNLLSQNLRQYGDLTAATAATRAQLNAIAQGQLQAAANRSQGALAKAQAQQALGQLGTRQVQDQLTVGNQLYTQALQNLQAGTKQALTNGSAPAGADLSLLSPEDQKRVVRMPVTGQPMLANTANDAEQIHTAQQSFDTINNYLDELDSIMKDQTPGLSGIPFSDNTRRASVAVGGIEDALKILEKNRMMTPEVIKNIKAQIPTPDSYFGSTKAGNQVKSQELRNSINNLQTALYNNMLTGRIPGKKPPGKPR